MVSHLWKFSWDFTLAEFIELIYNVYHVAFTSGSILRKYCNLCLKISFFFHLKRLTAAISNMGGVHTAGKKGRQSFIWVLYMITFTQSSVIFERWQAYSITKYTPVHFLNLQPHFQWKGPLDKSVKPVSLCVAHMHASCLFVSPRIYHQLRIHQYIIIIKQLGRNLCLIRCKYELCVIWCFRSSHSLYQFCAQLKCSTSNSGRL